MRLLGVLGAVALNAAIWTVMALSVTVGLAVAGASLAAFVASWIFFAAVIVTTAILTARWGRQGQRWFWRIAISWTLLFLILAATLLSALVPLAVLAAVWPRFRGWLRSSLLPPLPPRDSPVSCDRALSLSPRGGAGLGVLGVLAGVVLGLGLLHSLTAGTQTPWSLWLFAAMCVGASFFALGRRAESIRMVAELGIAFRRVITARRLRLTFATTATLILAYFALPVVVGIGSLGEICLYSPAGTTLCSRSGGAPERVGGPVSGLCRKPGIHYTGTTSVGTEVCFTLAGDGDRWIEIAYSFVGLEGCKDGAWVHHDGPAPFDAPGRIEVLGFVATISDEDAHGVVGDTDLCGDRQYVWSARRSE